MGLVGVMRLVLEDNGDGRIDLDIKNSVQSVTLLLVKAAPGKSRIDDDS